METQNSQSYKDIAFCQQPIVFLVWLIICNYCGNVWQIKDSSLIWKKKAELTKNFNNLTGGEMKLFYICEFLTYDHLMVSCPSRPSPHWSFTVNLWGRTSQACSLSWKLFLVMRFCCYQKPTKTDWSPVFQLMSSYS